MIKDLGVLINCSQTGGIKTVDEIKRFTKYLKAMGYTYIMLYTEDTYEIEGEPFFGYLRGRYSQKELKEIVSYCNSIGIEVIPCIQTLAHAEKSCNGARIRIFEMQKIRYISTQKKVTFLSKR